MTLDLKDLRATLRLAVELEYESGVRLRLHIQVELSGRALGFFSHSNPTVVEDGTCPRLRSRQIQRHGDFPEQPPGGDAAGSASPARVDRDYQAKFPAENRFSGKLLQIGLAQVKRGR